MADRRKNEFKNVGRGLDNLRQRRHNSSSELRTVRRGDQIAKRRNDLAEEAEESPSNEVDVNNLEAIVQAIGSGDDEVVTDAVYNLRRLLSKRKDPPIAEVIATNVVPLVMTFLERSDNHKLQFEAAWTITNIASGETDQTRYIVQLGGVEKLIALMSSDSPKVQEQAMWAIGNIAGDGPDLRDYCINAGGIPPLLQIVSDMVRIIGVNQGAMGGASANAVTTQQFGIIRTGTWTLSNFCRGKERPFEKVKVAIPLLASIIGFTSDVPTLRDACWALSYVTDGPTDEIQTVTETTAVQHLVRLLSHEMIQVQTPALRAVGNIVTGTELQTEYVLTLGALEPLGALLQSPEQTVRKEATWAVSNIAAGAQKQIDQVVGNNLIMTRIVEILDSEPFAHARREAAWTLTNIGQLGTHEHFNHICVAHDMLPAFFRYLIDSHSTKKLTLEMLKALERILSYGDPKKQAHEYDFNIYAKRIMDMCDLNQVMDFFFDDQVKMSHTSLEEVRAKIETIYATYFDYVAEDEEEDLGAISENITPSNIQL